MKEQFIRQEKIEAKQEFEQKKIETKQNEMNELFLQIPDLDPETKQEFEQEKINKMTTILIGCILSKIGLYLCFAIITDVYTDLTDEPLTNDSLLTWIIYFSVSVITQGIIGFFVDLIKLYNTWIFTSFLSIMGISSSILGQHIGNQEITVFGLYITRFCMDCNYVCGSFILYDCSYALDKRFNYAGLFIVLGSYTPQLLKFVTTFLPLQVEVQQFSLLIVSIICNAIGGTMVLISYFTLDKIRNKSDSYKKNTIHRGMGISFKSIIKYYWNENIFYLLIVLFVNSQLTSDLNIENKANILKEKDENIFTDTFESYFYRSAYASILIFVYPVLKRINSRLNLIVSNYRYLTIYLLITFTVQISVTVATYFQDNISFYFLYSIYQISTIINSSMHLVVIVICNQLLTCLQNERSSIKCIGLGIFGVTQDISQIIFIFQFEPIIIYLIYTLNIILVLVYNFYYQHNRDYSKLESIVLGINRHSSQEQQNEQDRVPLIQ